VPYSMSCGYCKITMIWKIKKIEGLHVFYNTHPHSIQLTTKYLFSRHSVKVYQFQILTSESFVTRYFFFFLKHLCALYDVTLICSGIYTAFSAFYNRLYVRVTFILWLNFVCMEIKERALKRKV
jgi:hypothetical protein